MTDAEGLLIQQTENVQSARQLRFTNIEQIEEQKSAIKKYVKEALEIEKKGEKITLKSVKDYPIPAEFQKALDESEELSVAFYG